MAAWLSGVLRNPGPFNLICIFNISLQIYLRPQDGCFSSTIITSNGQEEENVDTKEEGRGTCQLSLEITSKVSCDTSGLSLVKI